MSVRSLVAVVRERLRAEQRTLGLACAAAAVVGFLQPHGIMAITDPLGADLATRGVWLAGPMFFCSTIGLAVALLQGPGRHAVLDLSEQSAPLFGRELARAKAFVPAIVTTIAAFVYWFVQFLTGFAAPPVFFLLALSCVLAGSIVALNATVREGAARWLYIVLACCTAGTAYILAVYGDSLASRHGDAIAVGSELIFCSIVGFIALRQYGEALARYEPALLT